MGLKSHESCLVTCDLRVGHGSGNRKEDNVIPVTLHWREGGIIPEDRTSSLTSQGRRISNPVSYVCRASPCVFLIPQGVNTVLGTGVHTDRSHGGSRRPE